MKLLFNLAASLCLLVSCNNKASEKNTNPSLENKIDSVGNFFPVTSFLKGEILSIKTAGVTPVKKTTKGNKTDSLWLKMENLDSTFIDFLNPIIDTANLKTTFEEKKFLDQTINAFTFTYDPIKANDFAFTHWDVYVDPESSKVTRIYLVKKINEEKTLQLTWQTGKWCKVVTLINNNNKIIIEKEELTYWTFE
jgi:hypothetical protein